MNPSLGNATSAGGYTNANAGAVNSAVNTVGQFATTYQVPTINTPQVLKDAGVSSTYGVSTSSSQSDIGAFFSKVGSVFSEGSHLVESAADWTGRQLIQAGKGAVDLPGSLYDFGKDTFNSYQYQSEQSGLQAQQQQIQSQFKSGQISLSEYNSQMKDWMAQSQQLGQKLSGLTTKIASDGNAVAKDTITTASDVLTVMTAGLTSPLLMGAEQSTKDTATFLLSRAADDMMSPAEDAITKLAGDAKLFNAMPDYIQNSVKASVTDRLLAIGANTTSKEALRATATDLALKYPIAFNYLSGTGDKVYSELQSGKYGDAMKNLGFNAALLLSGGPIGEAMKYGGKALGGVKGAFFGSSSFLDTLSSAIGDHNPAGLYNAIKDDPELIKNFQALEASNMAATDGRSVDAAYRVINGLKADGWDLSQKGEMTHAKFVAQISNWYNAQKLLTDDLTSKIGADEARKIVVGRWTAEDANKVAAALTQSDLLRPVETAASTEPVSDDDIGKYIETFSTKEDPITYGEAKSALEGAQDEGRLSQSQNEAVKAQTVEQRLQAWEDYKTANPEASFANNENLDKQIKTLIKNNENPDDLRVAINKIKVQTLSAKNVSPEVMKEIGKMGYVPITPAKLEAPFVEGKQKIVSAAADTGSEFFTKAVQPLPVLNEVGGMLTYMGLSPTRADQSVHDIFNANLANNLQKTSVFKGVADEDASDKADTLIKQLTDYVNQTRAKISLSHPPITDLRQMTQKEIVEATGRTADQAKEIQDSIMDSMLQVPLSVRGLGDRIVDMAQRGTLGAGMRQYLRIQGAGRFAWNPFFKMKLAFKTEALTQLESGGKWPNLLGTHTILSTVFQGKYGDLEDTVKTIEDKGLFTSGYSNEAADENTAGYGSLKATGLLHTQKLSVAGLVSSMADKAGMTVDDFTTNFPNETRDVIESILHYDPKGDFINSPMARTLNFAFFPFRFNLKVSTFMAKAVARQSALIQVAVINGVMQAHHFLTSQEGQIWYSQNSDVLGLLTYFSPLETLSTISALGQIGHESIGAYGELGGLPAGFILETLQAEGFALNTQQAYLNPKTGQPSSNYIPKTATAKLATAISSFIGSIFTYPGSEAGLPSKAKLLNDVGKDVTGASSSDWAQVPQTNLTPSQQQYEQAVGQFNKTAQQASIANNTPIQQGRSISVPELGSATAAPYYSKTGSSTPPPTKLKKTQEPISPVAGQTEIGQLP